MLVNKKMFVLAGILVMLLGSVGTVWAISCLPCHMPTADSYHLIMAPEENCVGCHSEGGEDPPLVIISCENCHTSVPPDPPPIVTKCSECHISGCEGITVNVDIKPGSCPNSLNVNSGGVLPVAILGTADFDVTRVDIPSVELEGVSPLRWDYTDGSDGMVDLTLKFDMQEVVEALGEVFDGEFVVLGLTGVLTDEYGGTPIVGEDVVRILMKDQ